MYYAAGGFAVGSFLRVLTALPATARKPLGRWLLTGMMLCTFFGYRNSSLRRAAGDAAQRFSPTWTGP